LYKGSGASRRVVGQVKGLVRLVDSPDAEPAIDIQTLLSPRSYIVRVYILTGLRPPAPLQPELLQTSVLLSPQVCSTLLSVNIVDLLELQAMT
jgi:hypothetical protein